MPNLGLQGIPIDWTLLAETCNSWRIFWDVQMGQFAHNQAERFDCVSGYLEFAATGSTEAAVAFSPNCPGDCHHGNCPRQVNHTGMLGAARPGSFNDADMLPIGVKHVAGRAGGTYDAFTPIQARSAMALWVVLASPLMIGADIRTMDADSRSVWLNKGLIAAHQDPLGKQGVRIRGNATVPHVWRRELSDDNLLVVIYNPDTNRTTEAPTGGSPSWLGPVPRVYSDADCPNAGNHQHTEIAECKAICEAASGCDAFNYGSGGCTLRACTAANLPTPSVGSANHTSYRMTAVPAPSPSPSPSPSPAAVSITVTWVELGLAADARLMVTELIHDAKLGTLSGMVTVSVVPGGSAALRISPTATV